MNHGCPMTVMIPKAECKHRVLYRLRARNFTLGVYCADTGGFFGLRTKFGSTFVDEEGHWENEEYATAKPLEELPESFPEGIRLELAGDALYGWLVKMKAKYGKSGE